MDRPVAHAARPSTARFLLAVMVFVCLAGASPAADRSLDGTASVVDGDTLLIDFEHTVHLFGIDAWESGQNCPTPAGRPYPCGTVAAGYLRSLVENRRVNCVPTVRVRPREYIGICFHRGVNLGEAMAFKGWAVALSGRSQEYTDSEQKAREGRRGGFLGLPAYAPILPREWRTGNHQTGVKLTEEESPPANDIPEIDAPDAAPAAPEDPKAVNDDLMKKLRESAR